MVMMARIGEPTPEQVAAEEKADRLGTAMSALKWLAIGGGALFMFIAYKGRDNNASAY